MLESTIAIVPYIVACLYGSLTCVCELERSEMYIVSRHNEAFVVTEESSLAMPARTCRMSKTLVDGALGGA